MIAACHQPNFIPYPGFFYKMKNCDVFALSDTVKMSNKAFFNYNYLEVCEKKKKITIPVHGSVYYQLKDVMLCDWEKNKNKLLKTISQAYARSKYFDKYMPKIEEVLAKKYKYAIDLNYQFIRMIMDCAGIDTDLVFESSLDLKSIEPNADIINVCNKLGADTYLCGVGAGGYFDRQKFVDNSIQVKYSDYVSDGMDFSSVHYLLKDGKVL